MARRTKEEAAQTREALLTTAMQLYAEQGIHAVSLKQIAAACEVTHGALYWHFRNRDDLLQQLYLAADKPYETQYIEQRQSAKQDPLKALHDYFVGVINAYVNHTHFCQTYRLFLTRPRVPELANLAEQIDESHLNVVDQIHYFLKQAKKKKQLRKKISIKPAAKVLADVLDSLVQSIAFSSDEQRSSAEALLLIGILMDGLGE
jgi:AcrR family transcriptional regulator